MESECPSRAEGAAGARPPQDRPGDALGTRGCWGGGLSKGWGTRTGQQRAGDTQSTLSVGSPRPPALIPGSSSPGCPGTRRCRGPGASALPTLPFMALLQPKPKHGLRERSWSLPGAGSEGAPAIPGSGSPAQGAGMEQQRAPCHSTPITGVPKNSPAHPTPSAPCNPHPCLSQLPSCLGQSCTLPCAPACAGVTPVPPKLWGPCRPQSSTAQLAPSWGTHSSVFAHRGATGQRNEGQTGSDSPGNPPCLCPPTGCVRTQVTQLNPQCYPQGWLLSLRGSSSTSAPCQPHPGSRWSHRL